MPKTEKQKQNNSHPFIFKPSVVGYQWSLGGWTPSRKYESQHDLKSEAQISVQAWFLLSASYGTCQKQKFLIFKNGPMSENSCTVYPMYGPCSWEYDQPSNFMIFPDFPLCFRDKHQSQLTPKTFQVSSHGMMRSMRWHCGSNAALVLADHQPPCFHHRDDQNCLWTAIAINSIIYKYHHLSHYNKHQKKAESYMTIWPLLLIICQIYKTELSISNHIMWAKQFHKPSPNHHFYRWYGYHSQSWAVYGITHITTFNIWRMASLFNLPMVWDLPYIIIYNSYILYQSYPGPCTQSWQSSKGKGPSLAGRQAPPELRRRWMDLDSPSW